MRLLLLLLIGLVAITALTSGILLIYEPDGSLLKLTPGLLESSPFHSYLLPGLILAIIVGGCHFFALVVTGSKLQHSYRISLVSGAVLIGWVIGQMLLLSYFHWLQLVYLFIGLLIVLLAYHLMGKAAF